MLALAEAVRAGVLQGLAEIVVVFSNDPAAPGLDSAAALGLPTASLSSKGRKREEFDREVVATLQAYQPDYVVLAGYMRVLSPTFVRAFAGRIVNIHPADTHQHQGLHAYEWAFDNRLPDLSLGWELNLHNNVWGTNFPMWFGDDARFRFRVTARATTQ